VDTVMESDPLADAMQALVEPSVEAAPVDQAQVETTMTPPPVAPEPPPQPARTVPLPELMEERHKRQMAEREREAARRELELVQRFIEGQRQQQPPPPPIDPVTDPEGAFRALAERQALIAQRLEEQSLHQRANTSEMLARRDHGDEKVEAAVQAAVAAGINRNFMMQPDPYGALMRWHAAQQVAQEVGTDLQAYRQKVEAEIRERLIAEARAAGKPAPQNLPPSLSTATRASVPSSQVVDDRDLFKSAFAKRM